MLGSMSSLVLVVGSVGSALSSVDGAVRAAGAPPPCPTGYKSAPATGFWSNAYPGPAGHPPWTDGANGTVELCATKCSTWVNNGTGRCVAFEINTPGGKRSAAACFLFLGSCENPFTRYGPGTAPPNTPINTCVVDGYTPPPLPPAPPPPPPPGCPTSSCPQRGKTTGHEFPRLSNCWGSDPYITNAQ